MAKLKKVKKDKQSNSIDFDAIAQSFNSLDPQNMGAWPLVVKLTLALFIAALILAFAYMLPIRSKMDSIRTAEGEEATLLEEYKEKESKARNLNDYKQQILQMESTFAQLLDQLPKETRIPDLVEDINMRGVGSGVDFRDISVDSEIAQELFIEQPINIKSKGDYHEFGNFVSGIASLSRIITMHDYTITNANAGDVNKTPDLTMSLKAKTYRAKAAGEAQGGEKK